VSEQILNYTSAQLGYTVPFASMYTLENTGQKTNQKQTLQKNQNLMKSTLHRV